MAWLVPSERSMRVTLTIDDDVLMAARGLAKEKALPVDAVICELIRHGLEEETGDGAVSRFPVFPVSLEAEPIDLDNVKELEDAP